MTYKILITILFLLSGITTGGAADANRAPQDPQPDSRTELQSEAPRQVSKVTLQNNLLSVEFHNAGFGEAIRAIGAKAGFQVEGSSKAFDKKVTVKFRDMDIDNAIVRLFSLVKEGNYIIKYDTMGSISQLKVQHVREVLDDGTVTGTLKSGTPTAAGPRGRRVLRPVNPLITKDPSL